MFWNISNAQKTITIRGSIPQAKNKEILIKGFTMTGDSLLTKTKVNSIVNFSIAYFDSYIRSSIIRDQRREKCYCYSISGVI